VRSVEIVSRYAMYSTLYIVRTGTLVGVYFFVEKIWNDPIIFPLALEKMIHEKTWSKKSRDSVPLSRFKSKTEEKKIDFFNQVVVRNCYTP